MKCYSRLNASTFSQVVVPGTDNLSCSALAVPGRRQGQLDRVNWTGSGHKVTLKLV